MSTEHSRHSAAKQDHQPQLIETQGPIFFTSKKTYKVGGKKHIWESRRARKNLRPAHIERQLTAGQILYKSIWMPENLNWWIGLIFAIGATFFSLGCVLVLYPSWATAWGMTAQQVNATFFIGSIPFTTAAYLQLYQAANAIKDRQHGNNTAGHRVFFGWAPQDIGWHASMAQFIGTVLFNFNTFDAMLPNLSWIEEDIAVWVPNILGSILFLYSGYLAYAETVHKNFGWKLNNLSWWISMINFHGCIAFMISAIFALVLPKPLIAEAATISVIFTLIGAICFFIGALLMLPEAADSHEGASEQALGH